MRHLFDRWLPIYITLWPSNLILAIWSSPLRYNGMLKMEGPWIKVVTHETYWQALRITLRTGSPYGKIIRVIKKGTI